MRRFNDGVQIAEAVDARGRNVRFVKSRKLLNLRGSFLRRKARQQPVRSLQQLAGQAGKKMVVFFRRRRELGKTGVKLFRILYFSYH